MAVAMAVPVAVSALAVAVGGDAGCSGSAGGGSAMKGRPLRPLPTFDTSTVVCQGVGRRRRVWDLTLTTTTK